MNEKRIEKDSLGEIKVPKDVLYGAQTQRAIENFNIGDELIPLAVIHAYGLLKKACAFANHQQKTLSDKQLKAISDACDKIISGELDSQFPLKIWQTGSGTQTNMNVNEVISHYANQALEEEIHPNDHVNASQSSNDTFPTVMHMALSEALIQDLLPELVTFKQTLEKKIIEFDGIIRIGRTHLQDAVPISLSQSFSAYLQFIDEAIDQLHISLDKLYELPIGGTAVGTGINVEDGFIESVIDQLSKLTKTPFVPSPNTFALLSSHNAICNTSAQMSLLASNLNKIANDIRLLGSGPRSGLGELILPSNEPGSSIMPGKINPTQCEAISMVSLKVMSNHQLILNCNANGHFELNTYKPLIIHTALQSCQLLRDSCKSFRERLLVDLQPNLNKIRENLEHSLMLITALKPVIGYEKCAEIALHAHEHQLTLKESGLQLKYVTEERFDEHVKPEDMV